MSEVCSTVKRGFNSDCPLSFREPLNHSLSVAIISAASAPSFVSPVCCPDRGMNCSRLKRKLSIFPVVVRPCFFHSGDGASGDSSNYSNFYTINRSRRAANVKPPVIVEVPFTVKNSGILVPFRDTNRYFYRLHAHGVVFRPERQAVIPKSKAQIGKRSLNSLS